MRRSHVLAPGLALAALCAPLPVRWLARPARAALAAYGLTATVVSARLAAAEGARLGETARLTLVFVTMHGAGAADSWSAACGSACPPRRCCTRPARVARRASRARGAAGPGRAETG